MSYTRGGAPNLDMSIYGGAPKIYSVTVESLIVYFTGEKMSDKHQVFTIMMDPVAKGRPRFTKNGRTYTPKKTKEAMEKIAFQVEKERKYIIKKPNAISVYMRFFCKRPKRLGKGDAVLKTTKPDVDNYIKLVLDACNCARVWEDDSQVVEVLAQKWYCSDIAEPQIQLQVSVITNYPNEELDNVVKDKAEAQDSSVVVDNE
tara:strand:- start:2775 stop:3380 length:606 start_codon:yes stop_codon:yes gene_type:complete